MKIGKDGKICAIDDNPPTKEEIEKSLTELPKEQIEQLLELYRKVKEEHKN